MILYKKKTIKSKIPCKEKHYKSTDQRRLKIMFVKHIDKKNHFKSKILSKLVVNQMFYIENERPDSN